MKADYHIHTSFSDDSDAPMEAVIIEAINRGFDEICFTEHVDYGVHFDRDCLPEGREEEIVSKNLLNVNYPAYFAELDRLAKKYEGQIKIKKGLEFGIQVGTIPDYERLFENFDLDFVINSCHQADNLEFWNQDYQKNKTQEEYHLGYYSEILNVAKNFHHYNVLGHLDHQIRYDKQGPFESEKVDALIDEILKTVIADGKGLEINTSGYAYGMGDAHPSREILKRYRELGGEIITIGSDAHSPERVGDRFEEAKQILKDAGFESFCTFEKGKPIFHSLES